MTVRRVLLPQPIETEAMEVLRKAGLSITVAPDPKPEAVLPFMAEADAIVLRTGISIDRKLLDAAGSLVTISRTGAGVDNVDLKAATERGVLVTSSLGVNTSSVMEHCLSLILALFKQLRVMDEAVRNDDFSIRYKNLPSDLQGKTLGLMGFGRIGSLLGKACHTVFGMKVLAFDQYLPAQAVADNSDWVEFTTFDRVAAESDVISVHIPLTAETKRLFDAEFFRRMKPTAYFVNTSRGGVVAESDLIVALKNGEIAGAGLDVMEQEPPSAENELLRLPNVILTPHTAALTNECVIRMAVSGAERVVDVQEGRIPVNIANPDVLQHPRWNR